MIKLFRRLLGSSNDKKEITANIFWSTAEKAVLLISGIFVYARIASYLGTETFGYYNYLTSIYNIFLPIATLGLSNVLISQFLSRKEDRNTLMGTSAAIRLAGAFIAIVGNALFIYLATRDLGLVSLSFLMSWSYIFTIFLCIDEYFQSQLQSRAVSIVRIVVYSIFIAVKLAAIRAGVGLSAFILIFGVEFAFTTLGMIVLFQIRKGRIAKWRFDRQLLGRMSVLLAPILLTIVADTLATRYAVVVINKYMNISQVGIYGVASKLGEVWYFIPVTLCMAVYPKITKLFLSDKEYYRRIVTAVFTILFLGPLLLSLITMFTSRPIVEALFDENFLPAASVLNAYMFIGVFVSIKTLSQRLFILENVQKYLIIFSLVSSAVTITALYLLIPMHGALGAVLAIVLGHITYLFILPLFFAQSRQQVLYIINSILPWNYVNIRSLFTNSK
jgi:O-antigen/teichoic acid export membrane protein